MKNKIEFSENDIILEKQSNKRGIELLYNQSIESKAEYKQSKLFSKMIRGKVKVYNNSKFADGKCFDEESELMLISKRMLLFLKCAFLILIVSELFISIFKAT